MDKFIESLAKAGLHGAGLTDVDTPVLVDRYNKCMERLGIDPTRLPRFRIDGIGWSPEIAAEKGDNYLSHGIANRFAVVLTPDQRGKPIFAPFNSFDRRLMDKFFEDFREQVADITSTNAIAVAIDEGFSDFTSPQDLLLVDHVVVRPAAAHDELMEAAVHQRQLVERFMSEEDSVLNQALREEIIASATAHGDLRSRKLEIPEMHFGDLRSFYTEAFGGVFVVRTEEGRDDILVAIDKEAIGLAAKRPRGTFWIHDQRLVDRLYDGIVTIDFGWFRDNLGEIDRKLEMLAADVLCESDPQLEYSSLTLPQRKKMLMAHKDRVPPSYFELERVRKMLERGTFPRTEDLSRETQLVLIHPRQEFPDWYREVVWNLISRIVPCDPLRLYSIDKNRFFREFATWPDSKKNWAANLVMASYKRRMDRRD